MYGRSKSEPEFNFDNFNSTYTSKSHPKVNVRNLDQVKQVTDRIMNGSYNNSIGLDQEDVNNPEQWKEHMHFLESRLFAANHHIQKLERDAVDETWSRDKMHEVSSAMKEFITDSERKDHEYKTKINSLQNENQKLKMSLHEWEMNLDQQKQEAMRKLQQISKESSEKTTGLESTICQKNDNLHAMQSEISELKLNLKQVHREKHNLITEGKMKDAHQEEEIRRLKKLYEQGELDKRSVNEDIMNLTVTLDAMKAKEQKQTNELTRTRQDIVDRQNETEQLIERIKSTSDTQKQAVEQNKELERRLKQMHELEEALRMDIEEMKKKRKKDEEKMSREHHDKVMQLEKELEENGKIKQVQIKSISELKEANDYLQSRICEKEEKIRQLTVSYEESVNREKMLEVRLDKVRSNLRTTASSPGTEAFSEMMRRCSTKTEENLRNDLTETKRDLKSITEENKKLTKENLEQKMLLERYTCEVKDTKSTLERKLKKLEEENTSLTTKLDSTNRQITEYKDSLLQCKNTCEGDFMIKHKLESKMKEDNLIRTVEDLSTKLNSCTKEKESLTIQVQDVLREIEACKRDKERLTTIEHKQREELMEASKVLSNIQMMYNQLKDKCDSLSKGNDQHLHRQNTYQIRIKELESECHQLNSKFVELKSFITYARGEMAMLKTENEKWEEINTKLRNEIEKSKTECVKLTEELQQKNNDILSKNSEITKLTSQVESFKNQLNDVTIKKEEVFKVNSEIQWYLEEKDRQLMLVTKEKKKTEQELQESKKAVTNIARELKSKMSETDNMKKESYDLVQTTEELQKSVIDFKQNNEQQKRKIDKLKVDNKDLEQEVRKYEDVINSQREKIENGKQNERISQNKISVLEEANKNLDTASKDKVALEEKLKMIYFNQDTLGRKVMEYQLQCEELSSTNKELQSKLTTLTSQITSQSEESKHADIKHHEVMESLKSELREVAYKKKELESQLKYSNECLEKFKVKNSQLNATLQAFNEKQHHKHNESHVHSMSLKDIQNENEQLKKARKAVEDQNAGLKATLAELQGVIDGNQHKHSWIIQHGQEQNNEITNLKRDSENLNQQIGLMKEQFYKAQFVYDKMCEDFTKTKQELDKAQRQNEDWQREFVSLSEKYGKQIVMLKENLVNYATQSDEKTKELQKIQEENNEIIKQFHEERYNSKKVQEKYEKLNTEIEQLKDECQKCTDLKTKAVSRFEHFKTEFLRLVNLLKQMKKERDSLKTILLTTEEEKVHIKKNVERLQFDLTKIQKNLQETAHEKKLVLTDNETLKSRLSILKYTESTRATEQKELLGKLQEYEKQLKRANSSHEDLSKEWKRKFEETKHEQKKTTSNKMYESMLGELKNMLVQKTTKDQPKDTNACIRREMECMKEFLNQISKKEEKSKKTVEYIRYNVEKKHISKKSEKVKQSKGVYNKPSRRSVERLFNESKVLQDSLLDDISNFSKDLSFNFSFTP